MPTIRLNQASPIVDFDYSDIPDAQPAPTVVGAYPQWADGSDATYALMNTDGGGYNASAEMETLSAAIKSATAFRAGFRYKTVYPEGLDPELGGERQFNLFLWDVDATSSSDVNQGQFPIGNPGLEIPNDDLIHDMVIDVAAYFAEAIGWLEGVPDYYRVLLQTGGLIMQFAPVVPESESPYHNTLTIYEAWLEIDYGVPVIRKTARRDGLGYMSATRIGGRYPVERIGGHHP